MNKKISKILLMMFCLVIASGVFTACGGGGESYSISDLSKYYEQVEEYIVSPSVANIMDSQDVQSEVGTLSSANASTAMSDTVSNSDQVYNDTQKAYELLPDSLIELENGAKYIANKVKPSMNKVISAMPEENMWICYSMEENITESVSGKGNTNFARINTNTAGVMEYINVGYDMDKKEVIGGTYIKLTDTDTANEPIVEYYEFYGSGDNATGEYLYYVPTEQIYVNILGKDEYYCINDNDEFTSYHKSCTEPSSTTILNGSVDKGFVEANISAESQDNYYTYYKDDHKIMSLDYFNLELDLYYATEVGIEFGADTFVKTEISDMFGSSGYQYGVKKNAESYDLPSDVRIEELYGDDIEKYQADFRIVTDVTTDYGVSGQGYYVTDDLFLKLDMSSFSSTLTTFTNREEGNNLSDKLFGKQSFDELYEIYEDYFNEDSQLLATCASTALSKITSTKCSYDFDNFANNFKSYEIHYKYSKSGSGSSMVENYSTQISSPDLSSYLVSNYITGGDTSADVENGNASYSIQCSYNGYDIGDGANVILAMQKDGKNITVAQGDKTIKISSNDIEEERTTATFDLEIILDKLAVNGEVENGRYDLYAYFQDATTKDNKLDSLTEIIAPIGYNNSMYMSYAIEHNDKYYNVKVHTTGSTTLDFDESYYLIIEQVK